MRGSVVPTLWGDNDETSSGSHTQHYLIGADVHTVDHWYVRSETNLSGADPLQVGAGGFGRDAHQRSKATHHVCPEPGRVSDHLGNR